MSCTSRTFYRGSTFKATDERHAVGATIAQPDATANAAACLSEGGLEQLYHASSLAIIHFQVTNPSPSPHPNPNPNSNPNSNPTTPPPSPSSTSRLGLGLGLG